MMQAFYYHHLVPAHEWVAEVAGQPRPNQRAAWKVDSEKAVRLTPGGTAAVHVAIANPSLTEFIRLELNGRRKG